MDYFLLASLLSICVFKNNKSFKFHGKFRFSLFWEYGGRGVDKRLLAPDKFKAHKVQIYSTLFCKYYIYLNEEVMLNLIVLKLVIL